MLIRFLLIAVAMLSCAAFCDPLSRTMMTQGVRHGIALDSIPDSVKANLSEIEEENGCVRESANEIFLGTPPTFTGHEISIYCADQPYEYLYVYFDQDGKYLDTLTPGA